MCHRHSPRLYLLLAAGCFLTLASCGRQENPFNMAQASGKVTYADGRPIDAPGVTIHFVPQGVPPVGGKYARLAKAQLMQDGSFSALSTVGHNDGVIVGRQKVLVTAWNGPGIPCPGAVAAKYGAIATTPLEVDVKPTGVNRFKLTVEK